MQVTKQLIDEFQSEYPPFNKGNGMGILYSGNSYIPRNTLNHPYFSIEHTEARIQTARLEVWLKQRENLVADIGKIIVGARRPTDANSIIFVDDLPDWIKQALQASQPQEKERE